MKHHYCVLKEYFALWCCFSVMLFLQNQLTDIASHVGSYGKTITIVRLRDNIFTLYQLITAILKGIRFLWQQKWTGNNCVLYLSTLTLPNHTSKFLWYATSSLELLFLSCLLLSASWSVTGTEVCPQCKQCCWILLGFCPIVQPTIKY